MTTATKAKPRPSKTTKQAAEAPVKAAATKAKAKAPAPATAKSATTKSATTKSATTKSATTKSATAKIAAKAPRAATESKAEPRKARPAARPVATVEFGADWTELLRGALVAGGALSVGYDLERARAHGGHGDTEGQWGVHAYVQFLPGGEIVEAPVINFPTRAGKPAKDPKAVELKVDVPAGAQEVQVWFRNWTDSDGARVLWDSRFGQNYRFAVSPAGE